MIDAAARLGRLRVHPRSPHARTDEPLTCGLPLPRGRLADASRLAVADASGRYRPCAATVLERWSDGSIRWALVDTVADVPSNGAMLDVFEGAPAAHPTPLDVTCDGRHATVSSGGVEVRFDVATPQGLTHIALDGKAALGHGGLAWHVHDAQGGACSIRWSEVDTAGASALAATVTLRGSCTTAAGRVLRISAAWRFFAGQAAVGVDVELHNPSRARHPGGFWELGDAGSILVQSARMTLASVTAEGQPTLVRARLEPEGDAREFEAPFRVTQASSGGANWNSPVHVTAGGTLPFRHRGYTVESGTHRGEGLRANPILEVGGGTGLAIAVTAPAFWQVFPKAFGVSPDGLVEIAWLPAGDAAHEIQGGERCHFEFALGFGPDRVTERTLEWRRAPSVVLPDPETAAAAEAIPRLLPSSAAGDAAHDRLVAAAVDGEDTFEAKRERIDEYGWRHFGDLYADHENGPDPATRRVSHYNNQYDAVAGLITQALRTGDPRWWILADDLARHVARIDIYWTDEDKAAYNGGLFWHTTHYVDAGRSTHRTYPRGAGSPSGGPSNEHCYSTGLLLHHLLTGSALSAAAVERQARWLINADDGAKAPVPLPWLSAARTGYASATGSLDYHGPGRGAANAVMAMLNAARLTAQPAYEAKAHEIVARVVHPDDDIGALTLPDTERRWSYIVMLQALGCYHDHFAGRDHVRARYARATVRHYARWMAANEFPYLDKPELLEFPTETWAAHDLRKSEVLDLAALYAADAAERAGFAERARFFHRTALDTLARMPTRTRTRPLVLLMSNGFARAWHETRAKHAPLTSTGETWPARVPFRPQRVVAKRRLAILGAAAVAAAVGGLALLVGS